MEPTYTIASVKGSYSGSLEACCRWQAELQGAHASLTDQDGNSIHDVDCWLEDGGLVCLRAQLDEELDEEWHRLLTNMGAVNTPRGLSLAV